MTPSFLRGNIGNYGPHVIQKKKTHPSVIIGYLTVAVIGLSTALLLLLSYDYASGSGLALAHSRSGAFAKESVLISYAYFEKDDIQRSNFEYFLEIGTHYPQLHSRMHWVFVVSSAICSPCSSLEAILKQQPAIDVSQLGIRSAHTNGKFTLLQRSDNIGMDIANHNITLEYMAALRRLHKYKYFIFLNSSVKGPYFPSYMPAGWHWSHAYLARLHGDVHAVASSLVCLPQDDPGGPGPRIEAWAFALDSVGLDVVLSAGVFAIRSCKLCQGDSGVVVGGEYGITRSMLDAGHNVATLMSRYQEGVDWRDRRHWKCNDNVHPSRHGTYDGITFHPYETVFVKSSWHVADPYTRRYSRWVQGHESGDPGTGGRYNRDMYKYAVSKTAEADPMLDAAYHVGPWPLLHLKHKSHGKQGLQQQHEHKDSAPSEQHSTV